MILLRATWTKRIEGTRRKTITANEPRRRREQRSPRLARLSFPRRRQWQMSLCAARESDGQLFNYGERDAHSPFLRLSQTKCQALLVSSPRYQARPDVPRSLLLPAFALAGAPWVQGGRTSCKPLALSSFCFSRHPELLILLIPTSL